MWVLISCRDPGVGPGAANGSDILNTLIEICDCQNNDSRHHGDSGSAIAEMSRRLSRSPKGRNYFRIMS